MKGLQQTEDERGREMNSTTYKILQVAKILQPGKFIGRK